MKKIETDYDADGWKLVVKKGKDNYHIYYRSKYGHHSIHKPFYLRLSEKEINQLLKMLKELTGEK